jgi:hypothetical protein
MKPVDVATEGVPPGWKAVTYAEDQPEYTPLPVLKSLDGEGYVTSRWRPTWRERLALLCGADIWLTLMTFHNPLQPIVLDAGRPKWLPKGG